MPAGLGLKSSEQENDRLDAFPTPVHSINTLDFTPHSIPQNICTSFKNIMYNARQHFEQDLSVVPRIEEQFSRYKFILECRLPFPTITFSIHGKVVYKATPPPPLYLTDVEASRCTGSSCLLMEVSGRTTVDGCDRASKETRTISILRLQREMRKRCGGGGGGGGGSVDRLISGAYREDHVWNNETIVQVVGILFCHIDEPGSITTEVAPGFPHVGIVPDDAALQLVFSGISHFMHVAWPPDAHMANAMCQFSLHVNSMASVALLS
ncbi:hypothetical protein PR048_032091 [Dryococelus australis]|uniref:Uncharacterized protein n=1 Tax=Dryococelus australis TaxID=614101 RepID=A0ABQ9G4G9_9NEOP|nr:hypothetical protein PR048_032091 [Dryococelus australis]